MQLSYITDIKGRTEAVIIPKKDWDKMLKEHALTQKKLEILTGISQGLNEVALHRQGKKKLRTLADFLNEV